MKLIVCYQTILTSCCNNKQDPHKLGWISQADQKMDKLGRVRNELKSLLKLYMPLKITWQLADMDLFVTNTQWRLASYRLGRSHILHNLQSKRSEESSVNEHYNCIYSSISAIKNNDEAVSSLTNSLIINIF